jgi:hypothetical protein
VEDPDSEQVELDGAQRDIDRIYRNCVEGSDDISPVRLLELLRQLPTSLQQQQKQDQERKRHPMLLISTRNRYQVNN